MASHVDAISAGLLGFMAEGPIGAVVGAGIGNHFDNKKNEAATKEAKKPVYKQKVTSEHHLLKDTLVGGGAGFMAGGPVGALLGLGGGAIVGHHYDSQASQSNAVIREAKAEHRAESLEAKTDKKYATQNSRGRSTYRTANKYQNDNSKIDTQSAASNQISRVGLEREA